MEDSEISGSEMLTLESLPDITIEIVAKYLSPKDLAACCATSHRMRNLFDQSFLWKKKCDQELAEYLINTPCKVQPEFKSPQSENGTLPPISYWRKAYMAENHLWNNWRLGKYTEEVIENQHFDKAHYKCLFLMFHSNDIVIAKFGDRIALLDVKSHPAVDAVDPIEIPSYPEYKMHPVGDRLLIVSNSCVQVYHLDFLTKKSVLEHMFFVNEQEKVSLNRLQELNSRFCGSVDMKYVVTGSFLVGIPCQQSTMHIWNFKTGIKLKEQVSPLNFSEIATIKASNSNKILLMTFRNKRDGLEILLAYSLLLLSYLPFSEGYDGSQFYVFDELAAVWYKENGIVRLLDYQKNNSSTFPVKCLQIQSMYQPTILGNSFIFMSQTNMIANPRPPHFHLCDLDGGLYILNLNSSNNLRQYLVGGITDFEVLSHKFIQVRFLSGKREILELNCIYGSSFRNTRMNLKFDAFAFFLNKASTRYIIVRRDVSRLINFW